ncbi:MAG TPA: alpha/beta hydrolase [Longimicrobiaceae bacterium]|nr:alpha/beta hydrolase [Longimicrobiaceae bacterium]
MTIQDDGVGGTGRTLRVPAGGRSLHLREWGDPASEAVLLLHGIPTNGLLWTDVAPRLAARARVLAPDLLGYGRSDAPGGQPVDITAQAGYVVELLDALGIGRATVVGHDIGGGVAQILAVRHPERVARLGLVDSVCYDSWPIPEMKAIQAAAPVVEHMPAGLTTKGLKLGLRRGFVDQARAESFLDGFLEPFSTPEGLDVFVEHARSLDSRHTEEIAPMLPGLSIPAAVVWGRQDPFQKPEYAERLAADIPGAELTWIAEASHFSPADAPEPVAEALLRLLARPLRAGAAA